MKLIKTTLCSLLLILVGCSSKTEKEKEGNWRNYLAKQTINKVKNPYMIKYYFYQYYSNDRQAIDNKQPYYDSCDFEVYSLQDSITDIENITEYLHQFDDGLLRKSNKKVAIIYNQYTVSRWVKQSELTPEIFNPFDKRLKKDNPDLSKQYQYQRFLECRDFFLDKKPNNKKNFSNKYGLAFDENYRSEDFKNSYPKSLLDKVITDTNTLVRIDLACNISFVEFYQPKDKVFIKLQFTIEDLDGRKKYSPNQACYSKS